LEDADLAAQLAEARSGGAFRIPPRFLLRLSGPDAFRYLNGQVTRNLERLHEGEGMPACLLTPKGKLSAPVIIRREGDDLLVEGDAPLADTVAGRLDRYIVADDLTITPEQDRGGIHLFGAWTTSGPWSHLPGPRVARMGVEGRDLKDLEDLKTLGTTGLPPLLDPRVVEALRIERGIPAWGSELDGETLPPEAGLDRTHIDYDRGCYPGQEVVSRIRSIGRVNRLLRRIHAPCIGLSAGMELLDAEGKKIGKVTSASPCWDRGVSVALGYLPGKIRGDVFLPDPLTGTGTRLTISEIHTS
jgi:folate-binding protein YgfZ